MDIRKNKITRMWEVLSTPYDVIAEFYTLKEAKQFVKEHLELWEKIKGA